MLNIPNQTTANNPVALFTWNGGRTQWHNLRLHVTHASGTGGGSVTLKVNGNDVPDTNGAVFASVDPSGVESVSVDALLNDGDVVTAEVDGLDTLDILFSATAIADDV